MRILGFLHKETKFFLEFKNYKEMLNAGRNEFTISIMNSYDKENRHFQYNLEQLFLNDDFEIIGEEQFTLNELKKIRVAMDYYNCHEIAFDKTEELNICSKIDKVYDKQLKMRWLMDGNSY